jgi:ABC-type dipeptide/oligopeptide/nickel transport system permease component
MSNYIIRRLIAIIPLLLGITIASFAIIHLAPGKPTPIEQSLNLKVSSQARERLEKLYGLDKPLHIQYISWLGNRENPGKNPGHADHKYSLSVFNFAYRHSLRGE